MIVSSIIHLREIRSLVHAAKSLWFCICNFNVLYWWLCCGYEKCFSLPVYNYQVFQALAGFDFVLLTWVLSISLGNSRVRKSKGVVGMVVLPCSCGTPDAETGRPSRTACKTLSDNNDVGSHDEQKPKHSNFRSKKNLYSR